MPKLLIFDAFTLLIREKNVENYALLQCKIFSLKIWQCKILDKYHVWTSSGSLNHLQSTCSSLKAFWQIQTYIHGFFAGPWGARGSEAVWGSCCWWCWWEKYSFEKPAIFETKKTSNELQVREGWQSIFLHKNKRGWLPWRRFDKIFLFRIFFQ